MRGTPIRLCRALTRKMLFCGVDKSLLFLYGTFSVLIIYATRFQFPYAFLGVAIFFFFHSIAAWGHKKDVQVTKVLVNHIRYRGFYPAVSYARAKPITQKINSIPKL